MEIHCTADTRGIWLKDISRHPIEGEMLLDRSVNFRVIGVDIVQGDLGEHIKLVCEVI